MFEYKNLCETCGKEFTYTSRYSKENPRAIKRFCSVSCRNVFNSNKERKHFERPSSSKDGGWTCPICKSNFRTRRLLQQHKKELHGGKRSYHYQFFECYCEFCGRKSTSKSGLTTHKRFCKANKDRDIEESKRRSLLQKAAQTKPITRQKHIDSIKKRYENISLNDYFFSKKKIEHNGVLCDSQWEVEFLQRCDELQISYERCIKPLVWIDNDGNTKNYYPDFYLKDFDTIVEIKSNFVEKCQNRKGKISYIKAHYPNIIWLSSLDEIRNFNPSYGVISSVG